MSKISNPTKSFIILFLIAVFGTFLSLNLQENLYSYREQQNYNFFNKEEETFDKKVASSQEISVPEIPSVDTSKWKTYTDPSFNFSFKYKPEWKVLPVVKKSGYNILQIDPGAKYFNIKIYISPEDYYVMGGLPYQVEKISGQEAMNVSNLLFGTKFNNNFFTFDIGLSTSLKPEFVAMVRSVTFNK